MQKLVSPKSEIFTSQDRLQDVAQRLKAHGVQVDLLDDRHVAQAVDELVERAYLAGFADARRTSL